MSDVTNTKIEIWRQILISWLGTEENLLTLEVQKQPYKCCTIAICFVPRAALFELQAIRFGVNQV